MPTMRLILALLPVFAYAKSSDLGTLPTPVMNTEYGPIQGLVDEKTGVAGTLRDIAKL